MKQPTRRVTGTGVDQPAPSAGNHPAEADRSADPSAAPPEGFPTSPATLTSESHLLEQMRVAAALLEAVEHDRGLLARVP
ncbi:MAG: hypothetical protein QG573_1447, partial [Acidobacteriota bacterium]|nr:hypothetical protein [Acidobacteriota bacterium]